MRCALAQGGRLRLEVMDVLGRRVRLLADEVKEPGIYDLLWDGCRMDGRPSPSGVYFIRMSAGRINSVRKILVTH